MTTGARRLTKTATVFRIPSMSVWNNEKHETAIWTTMAVPIMYRSARHQEKTKTKSQIEPLTISPTIWTDALTNTKP